MDRFLNEMKIHAGTLDQRIGQPRFALVSSFDPATYTARVLLQPEGVLSGWLPVLSPWLGAGWGFAAPLPPGTQVLVVAQEGASEQGVVIGAAFSQLAPPPAAAVGEIWLQHQSGSFLKLSNDGSIAGQASQFTLTGNLTVSGNIVASGNVSDKLGTLAVLREDYNAHTHVVIGTTTSPPAPQD
jgi:phage baseplate assembly protein gpV